MEGGGAVMFAVLEDVSKRLGRPITNDDEVAQVNAWIGDVESLVLARIPDLETRVVDGAPTGAVVAMVVANAVIRKIKNPDGKVSEGVDDYNYRYNEQTRKGELFLTDDEWRLLLPVSGAGAFSIFPYGSRNLSAGVWVTPTKWVPAP